MFYNCNSITSIDLSSFNFSEVINMYNMFTGCNNLKKIKAKKSFIFKDMNNLFENNKKILKRNYCLVNSIQYKFNSLEKLFGYSYGILKELKSCIFDMGFQIFNFNDKTLFGGMEGPILSPYQNGFFFI